MPNNDQHNNKNTYEKNICCNITKRIMKAMFDKHYASKVEYFCRENGCKTKSFLNFYTKHKDKSIGIEKLVKLLIPKQ